MAEQQGLDLGTDGYRPLADRLRPHSLSDVLGQPHLLAEDSLFTQVLRSYTLPSLILWGPPGCGKTTIGRLLADTIDAEYIQISAITHQTSELKKIFAKAEKIQQDGKRTVLLVDEIHRFNRTQQDLFLPYVEEGTVILIGATTENPSFELNSALLSRCKVVTLRPLDSLALEALIERAEKFMDKKLPLSTEAKLSLVHLADGDGRYLLNMLEELFSLPDEPVLDTKALLDKVQKRSPIYDKDRDGHYNLISALHKSLRGSDVDAALYWYMRMLDAGEDPLYVARRLVRFASEDIGMADPQALTQAIAAKEAYQQLGSPEGDLAITQAVAYLATAPKSNALYKAHKAARGDAKAYSSLNPPKHILNAPTKLMKDEGYGDGYVYDHDTEDGFSGQDYFPDDMDRKDYYQPSERGFERKVRERLDYWREQREKKEYKKNIKKKTDDPYTW